MSTLDKAFLEAREYAAYEKRKKNRPKRINNADLPAGSPMYFYCRYCGHDSDCLPEGYSPHIDGGPRRVCDKCQELLDAGVVLK